MEEFLKPLATNAGIAGIILIWHLLVVGRKLARMEEAINRLTNSNLLRLAASPLISNDIKDEVARLLEENKAADERRKKDVI